MRGGMIALALLTGCAAIELDAEEAGEDLCRACQPALPSDSEILARWDRAGAAMMTHADTLGRIFDRVCPAFDTACLDDLDRELRPLAERTRALRRELSTLDSESCGYFSESFALVDPPKSSRRLFIKLLRASSIENEVLWDASWFVAGVGRTIGCCTISQ